jgi:hypothetical protein
MDECLASRRDQAHASYIQAGLAFAQPGSAGDGAVVCLCFTAKRASAVRAVAAALGVTVAECGTVHADAEATIAEIEAALHRCS